jgi:hypothetical protein
MSEKLGGKYRKEKRTTYLKIDSQEEKKKNLQNCRRTDENSEDTSCLCVLVHPEKCGFSAHAASCGHTKNALVCLPNVFA